MGWAGGNGFAPAWIDWLVLKQSISRARAHPDWEVPPLYPDLGWPSAGSLSFPSVHWCGGWQEAWELGTCAR